MIRWNEPRFGEEELSQLKEVLGNNYVNEGPKTKELEEKLKLYLGVKYILLTTNATAALFLSIKADSIIRGYENEEFEVITPDLTMAGTANSVSWAGGKVVLSDILKERLTIDPIKVKEKITSKTKIILAVDLLGRAIEAKALYELCIKNDLILIEDAAGALGSKNNLGSIGTLGKVGCFSLQSNKIITSGQGGIIATNDEKYYKTIKSLRDFGRFDKEEYPTLKGYNLKFNDLSAALALAQLNQIESKKQRLIHQYNLYKKRLESIRQVNFPSYNLEEGEVPLWVDIIVEQREELIKFLNSFQIYPRACWPAIHSLPPYKSDAADFNNSKFFSNSILWLPNGQGISDIEIEEVCLKIKEFYTTNFKKLHEDKRGAIYLVRDLLDDSREFTFLELKKGLARGGCTHLEDEYFAVIKGKLKLILGENERICCTGESGVISKNTPHAFIALEDSIFSEWGIKTSEKEKDTKDKMLRERVDKINSTEF